MGHAEKCEPEIFLTCWCRLHPSPAPVAPSAHAEYCSRGRLYDCLAAARTQPEAAAQMTWRRRLSMAVDAGAGMLYLHRRNIIHRDGELAVCLLLSPAWLV